VDPWFVPINARAPRFVPTYFGRQLISFWPQPRGKCSRPSTAIPPPPATRGPCAPSCNIRKITSHNANTTNAGRHLPSASSLDFLSCTRPHHDSGPQPPFWLGTWPSLPQPGIRTSGGFSGSGSSLTQQANDAPVSPTGDESHSTVPNEHDTWLVHRGPDSTGSGSILVGHQRSFP
jgi:hypothetical protein